MVERTEFDMLRSELFALRREVRRRRRVGQLLPVVALAALLALVPLALGAANPFGDLNPGSPHNDNIDAIYQAGVTKGCDPNVAYCPNGTVTREEMASFLARLGGLGSNPAVTNARTAVTATTAQTALDAGKLNGQPASAYQLASQPANIPDGSITPAKLSATGSNTGQVLTSTVSGVAWQNAPGGGGGEGDTIIWYSPVNFSPATSPNHTVTRSYGDYVDGQPNSAAYYGFSAGAFQGDEFQFVLPLDYASVIAGSSQRLKSLGLCFSFQTVDAVLDRIQVATNGANTKTTIFNDTTSRLTTPAGCIEVAPTVPVPVSGPMYLYIRVRGVNVNGTDFFIRFFGASVTLTP